MQSEIINNLGNPGQLEKLYRDDKTTFRKNFNLIYEQIKENQTAQIWNERLNYGNDEISWGSKKELIYVLVISFIAGLIAKIPHFTALNEEYFYPRNIGFIVFPALMAYFFLKHQLKTQKLWIILPIILVCALYINLLPDQPQSDTLILACMHLPLILWSVLGFAFTGDHFMNYQKRLDFLRYNGDLIVMTTIILIAGGILAGITLGLFSMIDINMEEFYLQNVGVWGLAAAPVLGTYLVRTNPHLVNKVSPVVAKDFTPLVLVTLVVYLIAVIHAGKDPYNDRDFLLIFNLLLIGVMAIILFAIAETSSGSTSNIETSLLFALALVTVILNCIALSAIVFRISEWGITPNRLAVLGSNLLILTHLLVVTFRLFKTLKDGDGKENVEKSIASFLPVYTIWAVIVTLFFPLLFGFK